MNGSCWVGCAVATPLLPFGGAVNCCAAAVKGEKTELLNQGRGSVSGIALPAKTSITSSQPDHIISSSYLSYLPPLPNHIINLNTLTKHQNKTKTTSTTPAKKMAADPVESKLNMSLDDLVKKERTKNRPPHQQHQQQYQGGGGGSGGPQRHNRQHGGSGGGPPMSNWPYRNGGAGGGGGPQQQHQQQHNMPRMNGGGRGQGWGGPQQQQQQHQGQWQGPPMGGGGGGYQGPYQQQQQQAQRGSVFARLGGGSQEPSGPGGYMMQQQQQQPRYHQGGQQQRRGAPYNQQQGGYNNQQQQPRHHQQQQQQQHVVQPPPVPVKPKLRCEEEPEEGWAQLYHDDFVIIQVRGVFGCGCACGVWVCGVSGGGSDLHICCVLGRLLTETVSNCVESQML